MDMEICGELMGQSRDEQSPTLPALTGNSNDNWGNEIHWEEWQQHPEEAGHHHVMCLKLGKRHYLEDATGLMASSGKRSGRKSRGCLYATADAPRCQVEGCHVPLLYAKDYHRWHRVCEMHSKAPKVVLLGLHHRFCQQCSRFHVISEFDDAKRSCRRRLAGHNERRKKTATTTSTATSTSARALSLLSSSSHLSLSSSAALRELIAQNRAAVLASHLSGHTHDFPGFHPHHHQDFNYQHHQQQHGTPSKWPLQLDQQQQSSSLNPPISYII